MHEFILYTTPILIIIWTILMAIDAKNRSNPRRIYPPASDFIHSPKDDKMVDEKVNWSKEGF